MVICKCRIKVFSEMHSANIRSIKDFWLRLSCVSNRSRCDHTAALRKQISSAVSCSTARMWSGNPSHASDSCCLTSECRVNSETGICTTLTFCSGSILDIVFEKTEEPFKLHFFSQEKDEFVKMRRVQSWVSSGGHIMSNCLLALIILEGIK